MSDRRERFPKRSPDEGENVNVFLLISSRIPRQK